MDTITIKEDIQEKISKRGRPRTQPLSKIEYNRQRYYEKKKEMNENNTKNMAKYRESYKILKGMASTECFKNLPLEWREQIKALLI